MSYSSIYLNNISNAIVDNIHVDGQGVGTGGTFYGIRLYSTSNNSIHNIQAHNYSQNGLFIFGSSFNDFTNLQIYNNGNG